ncbi:OsmC family protein [Jatrophihabitans fulvus]
MADDRSSRREHRFVTELTWAGSTAAGYREYGRDHTVRVPEAGLELRATADAAFRGDPSLVNPEQLLLAAASSCQLLAFLAVAARHDIDVRDYTDTAEAVMPVTREPMSITRIVLRPVVTVARGTDHEAVVRALHQGHDECFIANSLRSEIVLDPTVRDV